ncbi:hypothetical protein ACFQH8_21510 [Halomicroarcula sp. GCM10025710]
MDDKLERLIVVLQSEGGEEIEARGIGDTSPVQSEEPTHHVPRRHLLTGWGDMDIRACFDWVPKGFSRADVIFCWIIWLDILFALLLLLREVDRVVAIFLISWRW